MDYLRLLPNFMQLGPIATGSYEDAEELKKMLAYRKEFILVACMPKSGSTFLTSVLSEVTGYRLFPLSYAYHQNEQDLYLPLLLGGTAYRTVTQQHVRSNEPNLALMDLFSIKPVILVRNLFDVVASIHDHLYHITLAMPSSFIDKNYYELDKKTQIDFIIDLIMPWYIVFYVSWYDADIHNKIPLIWMTYEELMVDKEKAIHKILQFYGIQKKPQDIARALERVKKKDTRLNKGISGRGMKILTNNQRNKIMKLMRYYPWVDFSRIIQ